MYKQRSKLVELANEKISIISVCRMLGMEVTEDSKKVHCPFSEFFHSDGGKQRTFQVFDDHAYCYFCQTYYTPVRLYALANDLRENEAAATLLDLAGYKAKPLAELWAELENTPELVPDRSSLGQALRLSLARETPDWASLQFEAAIADKLDRCLSLLNSVNTEQDTIKWLDSTKKIMVDEIARYKHGT